MVDRIFRQFAQANDNLTATVLQTVLTVRKVKEQICVHYKVLERKMNKQNNDGRTMNSDSVCCVNTNIMLRKSTCC